ncbi:MAG TPA: hypothetical protein VKY40_05295 [Halanaerobiales bacterium]|nr:hypothetical protein [Halanaerobiales bacterium]
MKYKNIIEKLNNEIINEAASSSSIVNLAVKEMITAGGKKIRPLLLIISGKFGDYDEKKCLKQQQVWRYYIWRLWFMMI